MNDDSKYNYIPLPEPVPITGQVWPKDTIPLVSTYTITYNHAPYIRDCIEGLLMQKTTFPVKLFIFEDFSTDGTQDIIKEYEEKYPQLFYVIYAPENTYRKPIRKEIGRPLWRERKKAKYIAFCEGDDYWTDPLKLQKQVDFMEANPDCSLCFHRTRVKEAGKEDYFFGNDLSEPAKYTLKEFIKTNNLMGVRTPAMMIRKEISASSPESFRSSPVRDLSLQLYAGLHGLYGYLPDEMAVYRRGNSGAWSANNHTVEWRIKQIEHLNLAYNLLDKYTQGKYHHLIKRRNRRWITGRILYIQKDYGLPEQLRIIRRYWSYTLPFDKRGILIWMNFILSMFKGKNKLI